MQTKVPGFWGWSGGGDSNPSHGLRERRDSRLGDGLRAKGPQRKGDGDTDQTSLGSKGERDYKLDLRNLRGLHRHLWGLWAGLGSQEMSQGALGLARVPKGASKGSGPPVGSLGWAGFPRSVPEGSWPDWGHKGCPRGLWVGPAPGPQEGPRRSSQARVADGGGAPLPHIKARGAAGAHKAGRAGAKRGRGREGRDPEGPDGRTAGRREGGRGPGGRRGLRWGGAAAPHLIVHGCRPAPPPGPASLAAAAAAAAQRLPAALIVCQAPPPPLPAARPPASPAEPETTASPGRSPTPGPRRRLGPAAPTDSRLDQSTAQKAARGAGLPAWRGLARRLSEGRSP